MANPLLSWFQPRLSNNGPKLPKPEELTRRLSNVLFVDRGTLTPTALQDGSISRPFATITQAADLARTAPGTFTIVAVPGDYSAEGQLNLSANLVSWVSGIVPLGFEAATPRVTVASITQIGAGTTVPVTLQDVAAAGVSVDELAAYNCLLTNDTTVYGPMRLRNCATIGPINAQDVFESQDCTHEDLVLSVGGASLSPVAQFRSAGFVGRPAVTFINPGRMVVDDRTAYDLQRVDFSAPNNGTKELQLGAAQYIRMWVANSFVAGPPAQPGVIYNQTTPIVGGAIVRLDVPQANRQVNRTNFFDIADSPQGPITFTPSASVTAPALVRINYQYLFQLLATKDVTCWAGIQNSPDPTPRGLQQYRVNGVSGDRFNMQGSVIMGAIEDSQFWPCLRVIAGQQFAANELGVNDLFFSIEWMGTVGL